LAFFTGALGYTASSRAIICWHEDNWIKIWLFTPDNKVIRKRLPVKPVGKVYVSPGGRFVCFADEDDTHRILDVETMKQISAVPGYKVVNLDGHCFSPDETLILGRKIASRSRIVWSVRDGHEIRRLASDDFTDNWWDWWGADSQTIMIADSRGRGVHLWDLKANVVRETLWQQGDIWSAIMSPDTSYIATLDSNGIVRTWVWNGRVYRVSHTLGERRSIAYLDSVHPMAFTPDNRRLVLAAGRRQLGIYDLLTGHELGSPLLEAAPSGCKFTPDGIWLGVGQREVFTYLRATPLSEAER
jgi:WD40 repeat protein